MNLAKRATVILGVAFLIVVWINISAFLPMKRSLQQDGGVNAIPIVYLVTPTNSRLEQKADLTRLSYTLRHVPNLHWIIIEDSLNKTVLVSNFLATSKISYTHLHIATPKHLQNNRTVDRYKHPRGNTQRNAGLSWVRKHARTPGAVYFADDDNTYDIRLFEEMRYTKTISVWPVGFISKLKYGSPVCENGKVKGWHVVWAPKRKFATDMAGFAVSVQLIQDKPKAHFHNRRGYIETDFLEQLKVKLTELEPKANNCTEVLVWHTRTENADITKETHLKNLFGRNISRNLEV